MKSGPHDFIKRAAPRRKADQGIINDRAFLLKLIVLIAIISYGSGFVTALLKVWHG